MKKSKEILDEIIHGILLAISFPLMAIAAITSVGLGAMVSFKLLKYIALAFGLL